MTIIVYKCDTCDREIDILENQIGLEIIQRCVITDGCRGLLSKHDIKPDHIRGNFPDRVAGLTDWTQRKVLFNHIQSIALEEWIVVHDLGVIPSIQVFVERPLPIPPGVDISTIDLSSLVELIEIIPDNIETIDLNTVKITFSRPEKGTLQAIATASQPVQTENVSITTIEPEFQISNDQYLTIATQDDSVNLNITLGFVTPTGNTKMFTYVLDNSINLESPWSDFDRIFVDNKIFTLRSFRFTHDSQLVPAFLPQFSNNLIPSGSFFYIETLDGSSLVKDDMLILLSDAPYANPDKITNKFIDPYLITDTNNLSSFVFKEQNLFSNVSNIQNSFPPIRKI